MSSPREGITHFGLRNFKAFHYLEDIELRPLTVLVGPNSSGKSSILQSLALLKQTLLASGSKSPLKFDGDLVQLGSFDTVISGLDTSRALEYRFRFSKQVPAQDLPRFFPTETLPEALPAANTPLLAELRLHFSLERDRQIKAAMETNHWAPPYVSEESAGAQDENDYVRSVLKQTLHVEDPLEGIGVVARKLLPEGFFALTPTVRRQVARAREAKAPIEYVPLSHFPALALPIDALRQLLVDRLEVMGPVRADPRPFYPVGEDPEIGPRGGGAIPYLLRHQHDAIQFHAGPQGDPRQGSLLEALNVWLGRMGITQQLSLDLVPDVAFTAKLPTVSAPGKTVNLAQVGFGISQLLPVLLLGLKEPRDGLLLYEQPESQLHPRLQADLGDFFLSMARGGKTILLETHSDYLVNRLRRRIAEDQSGDLADLISILFVHPGTQDNPSSYVEPLTVGPDGTIRNCPADFFSEAADEAFALLRARAEQARRT